MTKKTQVSECTKQKYSKCLQQETVPQSLSSKSAVERMCKYCQEQTDSSSLSFEESPTSCPWTWNISDLSVYGLVNTVKPVLKQANKVKQTNNQTGGMWPSQAARLIPLEATVMVTSGITEGFRRVDLALAICLGKPSETL